jgi:hypothetical protein
MFPQPAGSEFLPFFADFFFSIIIIITRARAQLLESFSLDTRTPHLTICLAIEYSPMTFLLLLSFF